MSGILVVSTPATAKDLTDLPRVKTALHIAEDDTSEDLFIAEQIPRASASAVSYLNVARDQTGNATLGRETLVETFRGLDGSPSLLLSRLPVVSVASVVVDGATLSGSEYELAAGAGVVHRLEGDDRVAWRARKVAVTYVAGWLLPGQEDRDLPPDIEDAVIDVIGTMRSLRSRDGLLKSESVVGVGQQEFFGAKEIGTDGLTPTARALLDRHLRGFGFA